ncbi:unnamed protein product [Alopecurus aequalis]
MATTSTTSTALSMKLLVDTKAQRVLFTEASKDVVDFLFSLLSLPVGTAVKLLGKDSMVGCVGSLYGSVEKLDSTYVQPGAAKDALLHPAVLSPASSSLLSLPAPASTLQAQPKKFYKCNIECNTSDPFGRQRSCSNPEARWPRRRPAYVAGKGFVQGIVTYTVMDDLAMTPMSSISSITLLNTFAVKDLGALQEKTVQIGYNEGLEILKASLQSKTVLTDVFLAKKSPCNA